MQATLFSRLYYGFDSMQECLTAHKHHQHVMTDGSTLLKASDLDLRLSLWLFRFGVLGTGHGQGTT